MVKIKLKKLYWEDICSLENIKLENFRAIDFAELKLDGKSTVIFGINGTGNLQHFVPLIYCMQILSIKL